MSYKNLIKSNLFLIIFNFSFITTTLSQNISVPVNVQFTLFSKILAYNRNLKQQVGTEINIGIIYQKKFKTSLNIKDELIEIIKTSAIQKIANIPFHYTTIDVENSDIINEITMHHINILYITPLRAFKLKLLTDISRDNKIITITGVPQYAEDGISISVDLKGQKPEILINLTAAKAEGINFSAKLLKLAKIIK